MIDKQQKVIGVFDPSICPHCGKNIVICVKTLTPYVNWILKQEDLDGAKKKVLDAVNKEESVDKDKKKSIIEWLNDENTMFGPDEVESILNQLLGHSNV